MDCRYRGLCWEASWNQNLRWTQILAKCLQRESTRLRSIPTEGCIGSYDQTITSSMTTFVFYKGFPDFAFVPNFSLKHFDILIERQSNIWSYSNAWSIYLHIRKFSNKWTRCKDSTPSQRSRALHVGAFLRRFDPCSDCSRNFGWHEGQASETVSRVWKPQAPPQAAPQEAY